MSGVLGICTRYRICSYFHLDHFVSKKLMRGAWHILLDFFYCLTLNTYILSKKSSAQMGFRVNTVLARNSCIYCYISLFTEIIFQQIGAFKIEIRGTLTIPRAFKASRGHPSKVAKLTIMSPGVHSRRIGDCVMNC